MRLIDVKTHKLVEFFNNIPKYAILSHTWGAEEVTFQDYLLATESGSHAHAKTIRHKAGFTKIIGACERAKIDGLQYVWCDTNCIDKRSSAELSEALNSMYAWYRDSVVCYAFLVDVDGAPGSFAKSRWFTRGWTLQELLAPSKVVFFDVRWRVLGDRKDLAQTICGITRIHIGALHDRNTIHEYSVAQRMSWAADRQTSRLEDIAYCLLGIFDVNMPLLYGEGGRAFLRLQQEIIRMTDDQSILAWDLEDPRCPYGTGFLAPSPCEFRSCGSIVRDPGADRKPYSLTNIGISVNLSAIKTQILGVILVELNCARETIGQRTGVSGQGRPVRPREQYSVWLILVQSKDQDIYLKGHHPASKIFLYEIYPEIAHVKPTEIFLSTSTALPLWQPSLEELVLPFQRSLPIMSAGPLITVASGDFIHRAHILREAYPFNRFHIVPLKMSDESMISHHLISGGSFCVVISILLDKNRQLEDSFSSILFDPKARIISQMAMSKEWPCLFDTHHPPRSECCSTRRGLKYLHERLRQIQTTLVPPQGQNEHPLVLFTSEPIQDVHGNPEVLISIVFREKRRSH
ncbi:HET-domain-containing protein [Xylaria intraflava]|nr:HET-domain-containing protein [Xylaria intraflava]